MNGFLMQAEVYFRKQIRIKQKIYELFTIKFEFARHIYSYKIVYLYIYS